jgi:hypothetical protein
VCPLNSGLVPVKERRNSSSRQVVCVIFPPSKLHCGLNRWNIQHIEPKRFHAGRNVIPQHVEFHVYLALRAVRSIECKKKAARSLSPIFFILCCVVTWYIRILMNKMVHLGTTGKAITSSCVWDYGIVCT